MTDDREILRQLLADPSLPIDEAWVRSMEAKYPFFSLPWLMKARAEGKAADEKTLNKLTLAMGRGDAWRQVADPEAAPLKEMFYPAPKSGSTSTTTQTIDTFLATYGSNDPSETATLEKLIFNPVPDYSQQLERQNAQNLPSAESTDNDRDDRINRFILSHSSDHSADSPNQLPDEVPIETPTVSETPRTPLKNPAKKTAAPTENTLLSESLAKIYIKNRHYDRAYEILANLCLAFPEKSAYFAVQMRFLRKAMLNEQYRLKRSKEK